MIWSDLPLPAEAGFAKAGNRFHPRIKSEGKLFEIMPQPPLAFEVRLRREGGRTEIAFILSLANRRMSEARLTSLTIESPPPKRTIAVRAREGKSPGLFWLGGFKSDMKGTKAAALDGWAQAQGRACVRFDYSGHGESGGDFNDGTIGCWLEESLAVYTRFAQGPQVVVGSSMGGWLALLLAQSLRKSKGGSPIAGMVLIAPAVDFTEELMWKQFSKAIKREIETKGAWMRPSEYSEGPYPITKQLIEDGRKHLLLGGMIETGCPVHILQGVQDPDVPWRHAVELVSRFARDDVVLTLIKDGDHRLSRPENIERLIAAVKEF
jgi:pimeloyl-ACP methyl ester carboxylesterase